MIVLDKVFRQKDNDFSRLLNELRRGIVSKNTNDILTQKVAETKRKKLLASQAHTANGNTGITVNNGRNRDGGLVLPTKLFATNRDVDSFNLPELNKLTTEEVQVRISKSCRVPKSL